MARTRHGTCTIRTWRRTARATSSSPTACSASRRSCPTCCTARPSPRARRCTTGSSSRTATRRLHQLLLVESGGGVAHLEGGGAAAGADGAGQRAARRCARLPLRTAAPQGYRGDAAPRRLRDELLRQAPRRAARCSAARAVLRADERDRRRRCARSGASSAAARRRVRWCCAGCAARLLGAGRARCVAAAERRRAGRAWRESTRCCAASRRCSRRTSLEHWKVADYARALAVTPTHLSRVVRAATGEPASRLIEVRLMREARRHLVYTQPERQDDRLRARLRRPGVLHAGLHAGAGDVAAGVSGEGVGVAGLLELRCAAGRRRRGIACRDNAG